MTAAQDVDIAALHSLSERLVASLNRIENDHWARASPCADWDLAALVDHVAGGNWFTIGILNGQSADDALTATIEMFDGATVTRERAVASVAEQVAAFNQPGVLDETHDHVAGDLTGRQILRLRLHDLIIHNWDIEETLAPPASIAPVLIQWGTEEMATVDSLVAEHFGLAEHVLQAGETAGIAYLRRFNR